MSEVKDKYILSEESAKEQIEMLVEFYGLEDEEIDQSEHYRIMMNAIKRGLLEIIIDEKNMLRIEQKLMHPPNVLKTESLIYKVCDAQGKNYIMSKSGGNPFDDAMRFITYLTTVEREIIDKLFGIDLRIAQAMANMLFLA